MVVAATAQDGWQHLSVSDTGVGMNPEELCRLFRIDVHFSCPGTESERGHGMGLILCKELADLNRGRISVRNAPSKGSNFSLRLPLS